MLDRIDNFLMHLAKILIITASFFGVSRKQFIVIWILLAGILHTFADQFNQENEFNLNVIGIIFWTFCSAVNLSWSLAVYRDDDVLPSVSVFSIQTFRLSLVLMNPLCSILIIFDSLLRKQIISIGGICLFLPFLFFIYLLLSQNIKSRITLKGLIKQAATRLVFQPEPS